jgi:hypothetical protein
MALIRSGQKNLDEIQRIRVAMEGSSHVATGAQRELIEKYAALLGEDGRPSSRISKGRPRSLASCQRTSSD